MVPVPEAPDGLVVNLCCGNDPKDQTRALLEISRVDQVDCPDGEKGLAAARGNLEAETGQVPAQTVAAGL